ncbi:hypothetical protein [Streptomyces sp. SID13031]|uniref:hypothetical protein n=1 Tax=Streptomyces sp. SID13031 TaxID=2706046 RepID=UPI0013C812BC|nr:hypothetical protein [Streptomyces sp. SID13031]NEA35687.1 hypothetical protein [Streptomyces sp. SID13031]
MPKLTDEEVGQLLRETFTEKEDLLEQLPEATSRAVRRKAPALLAAAAVLAVLGGGISIAGTGPGSSPSESAKGSTSSRPSNAPSKVFAGLPAPAELNTKLTGLAIAELTKWERPAGGWPVVKVLDASYEKASSPIGGAGAGTPLSKQQQAGIAKFAGVPISWVKGAPAGPDVCTQADGTPYVTLGPIVMAENGSSATIGMSMWRGCLDAQWLTYRLTPTIIAQEGGAGTESRTGPGWTVAGTVGPVAVA